MNGARHGAREFVAFGFLGLALPVAAALPSVSKAELARCAGIDTADERLACYDALAGRIPPRAPVAPADAQRPPAAPADTKRFGLTKPVPQATPSGPQLIQAQVVKLTESQFGTPDVILDNGQTWELSEPGAQLKAGDVVTIKRAALGSFLMMTPAKKSYRVRRLQ
jgi:hypothetical protein